MSMHTYVAACKPLNWQCAKRKYRLLVFEKAYQMIVCFQGSFLTLCQNEGVVTGCCQELLLPGASVDFKMILDRDILSYNPEHVYVYINSHVYKL